MGLIALPVFVVVAALVLDLTSRRGFGLVLVVLVTIGLTVLFVLSVRDNQQQEAAEAARVGYSFRLGWPTAVFTGFFLIFLYSTHVASGLIALALAVTAFQWRWFIGIVAGLLFLAFADYEVVSDTLSYQLHIALPPLLVGAALLPSLAYGIWRIVHPQKLAGDSSHEGS